MTSGVGKSKLNNLREKNRQLRRELESVYQQRHYVDKGRILCWGCDLDESDMEALRGGEVFTLVSPVGQVSKVLMDSYGAIRERILV